MVQGNSTLFKKSLGQVYSQPGIIKLTIPVPDPAPEIPGFDGGQ